MSELTEAELGMLRGAVEAASGGFVDELVVPEINLAVACLAPVVLAIATARAEAAFAKGLHVGAKAGEAFALKSPRDPSRPTLSADELLSALPEPLSGPVAAQEEASEGMDVRESQAAREAHREPWNPTPPEGGYTVEDF